MIPLGVVVGVLPVDVDAVETLFLRKGNQLTGEFDPFFRIGRDGRHARVAVGHAQNDLAARIAAQVLELVQSVQELFVVLSGQVPVGITAHVEVNKVREGFEMLGVQLVAVPLHQVGVAIVGNHPELIGVNLGAAFRRGIGNGDVGVLQQGDSCAGGVHLVQAARPGDKVHAQPEIVVSGGEGIAPLKLEGFRALGNGVEDGDGAAVGLVRIRGKVRSGCGREYLRLGNVGNGGGSRHGKGHAFQYLAGFWGGHFDFHDGLVDAPRIQDGVCLLTGGRG